jgi:hypothetical protein
MGDLEIGMHRCAPIIYISVHGYALRGEKAAHVMRASWIHNWAWVCDCVVVKRTVMRACVHDKGTWRCLCLAYKSACVHAYVVNRCACVCVCGVKRHAYVRTYGFKQSCLGGKADG